MARRRITCLAIFFFLVFIGIHTIFTVSDKPHWLEFYTSCHGNGKKKKSSWDVFTFLVILNFLVLLINVNYKEYAVDFLYSNSSSSSISNSGRKIDVKNDLIYPELHEFSNHEKDLSSDESEYENEREKEKEKEKENDYIKNRIKYMYSLKKYFLCTYSIWILCYYSIFFFSFLSFIYGIRLLNNSILNVYMLKTCTIENMLNYTISEETFISFYWVFINFTVFISKYKDPLYISNYFCWNIKSNTTININYSNHINNNNNYNHNNNHHHHNNSISISSNSSSISSGSNSSSNSNSSNSFNTNKNKKKKSKKKINIKQIKKIHIKRQNNNCMNNTTDHTNIININENHNIITSSRSKDNIKKNGKRKNKKYLFFLFNYLYQVLLVVYCIYKNSTLFTNGEYNLYQIVEALNFLFIMLYTILEITNVLEINKPCYISNPQLPFNYIWAIICLFVIFLSSIMFYFSVFGYSFNDHFLNMQFALWFFFLLFTYLKKSQLFVKF